MNTQKTRRQNPLEVAFRKGEQTANTQKYIAELEQKSFYESARLEFVVSGIASYGANLVSILTAVSFCLLGLAALMPDILPGMLKYSISGGIALGALILLEVVKRSNTTAFFRKRYTVRKVSSKNAVSLVALSVFSIILSILGASDLARIATDESSEINGTRADGIAAIHEERDLRVNALEREISALKARTDQQIKDKLFLTYPQAVTSALEGMRNEQQKIREDVEKKTQEVELAFTDDSTTNEQKSRKALYFMLGLSSIAELLAVLCLWFRVYYKYKVVAQSGHEEKPVEEKPKKLVVERVEKTREPIKSPLKVRTGAYQTETDDRVVGIQKNAWREIKPCARCNSEFTPRAKHQKFCSKSCKNAYHKEKQNA